MQSEIIHVAISLCVLSASWDFIILIISVSDKISGCF